ncbi:hypothetical protein PROFUN_06710 [Planoprotostelium fungivorum]|uniref:Uncharacterized protein n=1 Tax=Planoprotostelium fungivorum TaxID=1890364 RepID=A0A2P6NG46_9EUKA|nr:hypothetical protein PROFUN_06710 [Planoprotostelium fungivorum]
MLPAKETERGTEIDCSIRQNSVLHWNCYVYGSKQARLYAPKSYLRDSFFLMFQF